MSFSSTTSGYNKVLSIKQEISTIQCKTYIKHVTKSTMKDKDKELDMISPRKKPLYLVRYW